MTSICHPGFRAVEKEGEDDGALFGFKANSPLLPDIYPQSPKGAARLADSVVDLGECTTQVCDGLYRLKGLICN